jgi:hypothetical protein
MPGHRTGLDRLGTILAVLFTAWADIDVLVKQPPLDSLAAAAPGAFDLGVLAVFRKVRGPFA